MKTADEIRSELQGCIGSERWIRSNFNRKLMFTDGVDMMRELCHAHWLVDAIASHHNSPAYQRAAAKDERLQYMAFWKLAVNADKSAVLTCIADSGEKPIVRQEIEYTDFPLDEILLYSSLATEEGESILMLPSEY